MLIYRRITRKFFRQIFVGELSGKMSKTTNRGQFEILLNAMQENPDIARGFFKGPREDLSRFWSNLEVTLNSAGPPSKTVVEWKKVWADQKKYVRHKAAQNLSSIKATGGGPNVEQKYSATDQAIYELIAMKESVEGVARSFGLNSTTHNQVIEIPEEVLIDSDSENQPPPKRQKKVVVPPKTPTIEIMAEEVAIQRKMYQAAVDQNDNLKKVYRSIDRLYSLKKDELSEQKRHNLEMEGLRLREVEEKIERNRKLIELEELKNQM